VCFPPRWCELLVAPPLFTFESCDEKSAFDDVTGISGDAVSGRGVASLEQTSTEGGEATRTL